MSLSGGTSAGSLLVEISPDTTRFGQQLASQAEAAARQVDAGVTVVPDTDSLLSRLRVQMERLGGKADLDVDVEPDVSGLAAEVNTAAEVATAGVSIDVPVDPSVTNLAAEVNTMAEVATAGVSIDVPISAFAGPGLAASVAAQTQAVGVAAGASGGTAGGAAMGKGMGASMLKTAGPLAAAAGVAAGGLFAYSAWKGAEVQASAKARLTTVFKQMGYEKNAQAALDYANSLETVTGIERESIKDAQAKLATFKTLAKDQDQLARATALSADLSAAGFGDMGTQAVGLGKALADPANGLALLTKQGAITKTEQKAIQTELAATGDVGKAQGQIFEVLEKQVGGVAEATADTSKKMSLKLRQIGLVVGEALLPVMDRLLPIIEDWVDWTIDNLPKVGAAFRSMVDFVRPIIDGISAAFSGLFGGDDADGPQSRLGEYADAVRELWDTIAPILAELVEGFREAWDKVAPYVTDALAAVRDIVSGYLGIVANIIGKITGAIRIIWEKWGDRITFYVTKVFELVAKIISGALRFIAGIINTALAILQGDWGAAWDALKGAVGAAWDAILGIIELAIVGIAALVEGLWETFKTAGVNIVKALWSGIASLAGWIGEKVGGFFRGLLNGLPGFIKKIFGIDDSPVVVAVPQVTQTDLDPPKPSRVPTPSSTRTPTATPVDRRFAPLSASSVEQNVTFNNYYPKPEKVTDSASMQMRRAAAALGAA